MQSLLKSAYECKVIWRDSYLFIKSVNSLSDEYGELEFLVLLQYTFIFWIVVKDWTCKPLSLSIEQCCYQKGNGILVWLIFLLRW